MKIDQHLANAEDNLRDTVRKLTGCSEPEAIKVCHIMRKLKTIRLDSAIDRNSVLHDAYRVSNTRRTRDYPVSAVRIYRTIPKKIKIAEAQIDSYDPLKYLKARPNSIFWVSLIMQLRANGVTDSDIELIFTNI